MLFLLFPKRKKGTTTFLRLEMLALQNEKHFFSCCLIFKRLYILLKLNNNSKSLENAQLKYIIKCWIIMIVKRKTALKIWIIFDKTLASNHYILPSVTHSGNKINRRLASLTYNLWVIIWLREKEVIKMKDQTMKTSLNLLATLSGCLLLLHWRLGFNQNSESVSLRQSWGGQLHMTACCVMHDTFRFWAQTWNIKIRLTKSFMGTEWM